MTTAKHIHKWTKPHLLMGMWVKACEATYCHDPVRRVKSPSEKKHVHEWSPKHKRMGVDLLVRVCLIVGCEAVTDEKNILFKDGYVCRLSSEMRRQFKARLTLQSSQEGKSTS